MTVITVPVDDELEAPRADTDPAEAAATVGLGSQAYEALLDLIFSRELKPVSYTHLPSPRDLSTSRMPSSA